MLRPYIKILLITHNKLRRTEKDAGFPLKSCGNDKVEICGNDKVEVCGNDKVEICGNDKVEVCGNDKVSIYPHNIAKNRLNLRLFAIRI